MFLDSFQLNSRINTPRKEGGLGRLKYPLLSDLNHQIAKDYGVLLENEGHTLRWGDLFLLHGLSLLLVNTFCLLPILTYFNPYWCGKSGLSQLSKCVNFIRLTTYWQWKLASGCAIISTVILLGKSNYEIVHSKTCHVWASALLTSWSKLGCGHTVC